MINFDPNFPVMNFLIRKAERTDTPKIFDLIHQLAVYEKLRHEMVSTLPQLEEQLFTHHYAEVLLAEENGKTIGFALYFYNFSTFLGKPGLYLEDLFVEPGYRGKGYGKKLFSALARTAREKNCGRMEWSVLKWNKPSISFYESLGAKAQDEWTVYRLQEQEILKLAE